MGGGGSVVEDVIEGVSDVANVTTGGALLDEITSGAVSDVTDPLTGVVSGKNKRLTKEAEAEAVKAGEERTRVNKQNKADAVVATEERRDTARRAGSSRSRTLLTGAKGIEEDEGLNISRKTLLGS